MLEAALHLYDAKKGFLRRLFGDSQPIKELRKFYRDHPTWHSTEDHQFELLHLLRRLKEDLKNSFSLTAYVVRNAHHRLEQVIFYKTSLLAAFNTLPKEVDFNNFNFDRLNKLKALTKKGLTKEVLEFLSNYPDENKFEALFNLLYRYQDLFSALTARQFIALLDQFDVYNNNHVFVFLKLVPPVLLTTEFFDTMIALASEEGEVHEKRLRVMGLCKEMSSYQAARPVGIFNDEQLKANQARAAKGIITVGRLVRSGPYGYLRDVFFPSRLHQLINPSYSRPLRHDEESGNLEEQQHHPWYHSKPSQG